LPFRPNTDPQGARTFIQNFYRANAERSPKYTGAALQQELRLTEPIVLCSIMKWCWSRLPNGVVTWPVYEGFRMGEKESKMARNAFDTFVPISAESEAHKNIIFDFFDLIAAVAAHGKNNGLTGRKLSRLAGWWAFEHADEGNGFEGGYKSWLLAADATSHLFFAYLRSLSPDTDPSMNVIERIPRSLQALLHSTEYPPETPTLMQRSTPRVVMVVSSVSPTPFSLLRRAKNFEYRDNDEILREYAEFEDPIDALTDECKRVLYAISTTNQSSAARSRGGPAANPDESWSAFSNMGFSDIDENALTPKNPKAASNTIRSEPQSRNADNARPTTPSWADFLSSGFADDGTSKPSTLLYPPAQVLPPLGSPAQSALYKKSGSEENLAPGELAAIKNVELDDVFWWVWMTSLAGEEPSERKAVFGRCALVETTIMNGRWLIMEEQVKGATPDPTAGAYIAPKKSIFSFTKRTRLGRKRSTTKHNIAEQTPMRTLSATPSKTSLAPDQHARIKAAAAALTRKTESPDRDALARRGKADDTANKTNNALAVGLQSEAGPAMKFINAYDKNAIRAQYLGDSQAGTGATRAESSSAAAEVATAAAVAIPKTPVHEETPAPAATYSLSPQQRPYPVSPKEPTSAGKSQVNREALAAVSPVSPAQNKGNDASQSRVGSPSTVPAQPEPSSPVSLRTRKPVPKPTSPVEQPAYHSRDFAAPSPVIPMQNSAAIAAARAMQTASSPTSPITSAGLSSKKSNAGNGGLKKFFKKKDNGDPRGDSLDLIRPTNAAPGSTNQSINRRLSLMRRKEQSVSRDSVATSTSEVESADFAAEAPSVPTYQPAAAPPPTSSHYEPTDPISRVNTRDEEEQARHEFSRFDQGPMMDMPAIIPTESLEEAPSPEHTPREVESSGARNLVPQVQVPADYERPVALTHYQPPPTSDRDSETTIEDHRDAGQVQDRWATIRENAARRANRAEERQSEDQSTPSRFSQSVKTDDGETSGEESKFPLVKVHFILDAPVR
jgi:hypothetical protein